MKPSDPGLQAAKAILQAFRDKNIGEKEALEQIWELLRKADKLGCDLTPYVRLTEKVTSFGAPNPELDGEIEALWRR